MKFKNILPHVIAIIAFVVICFIYFNPVIDGKQIKPLDIQQSTAWSKEILDFKESTGKITLWTNSMYCGMPTFLIWCPYPSNFGVHFWKFINNLTPIPVNWVLLYLVCAYIFFCCLKINPWLSFLGSVAFAFTSYNFIIIDAGHYNKVMALAVLAPLLGGIMITLRGNYLWGGLLTAICVSLEICATHLQITYYFLLSCLIIGLVEFYFCLKQKHTAGFFKAIGVLALAVVIGLGPNVSSIWTTYEYSQETTRGKSELVNETGKQSSGLDKEAVYMWSYGIMETFTFLIPNFYGGATGTKLSEKSDVYKTAVSKGVAVQQAKKIIQSVPLYWGDQPFTSGPAYMGSIVCFMFLLGLLIVKGPVKWWCLLVFLFTVFVAWGKNFSIFNDFLYDYLPMFKSFRSITMIHVVTELVMVLLGIMAIKKLTDKDFSYDELKKGLLHSLIVLAVLTLFFSLMPGTFLSFKGLVDETQLKAQWPDWLIAAIVSDRESMLKQDAFRSLIFILLAAGFIWLFLKKKIKSNLLYAGLILLMLGDMWSVNKRYLNNSDFYNKRQVKETFVATRANLLIQQDTTLHHRVLDLTKSTFSDAQASYFHKSVGGYHAAMLRRYKDLIENQISKNNMSVLNMLNTKYFILKNPDNPNEPTPQINPNACGAVWLVDEYKIVQNANEEMDALTVFNPLTTAIVDKRFEENLKNFQIVKNNQNVINLVLYEPNYLVYNSSTNGDQLAVFSEIYYDKGWNAYIDGKLVPHIRVNYILRAMKLPAGQHKIEFKFEPVSYDIGEKVSFASSITLIALLLLVGIKEIIRLRKVK